VTDLTATGVEERVTVGGTRSDAVAAQAGRTRSVA
jgi:hypothetical protein